MNVKPWLTEKKQYQRLSAKQNAYLNKFCCDFQWPELVLKWRVFDSSFITVYLQWPLLLEVTTLCHCLQLHPETDLFVAPSWPVAYFYNRHRSHAWLASRKGKPVNVNNREAGQPQNDKWDRRLCHLWSNTGGTTFLPELLSKKVTRLWNPSEPTRGKTMRKFCPVAVGMSQWSWGSATN